MCLNNNQITQLQLETGYRNSPFKTRYFPLHVYNLFQKIRHTAFKITKPTSLAETTERVEGLIGGLEGTMERGEGLIERPEGKMERGEGAIERREGLAE
ncbi:MAG: hypothetical protein ACM3YE_08435 [Bacteroidota bacterium]